MSAVVLLHGSFLSGCQQVPLERGGSLLTYSKLAPSDGMVTKALVYFDPDRVRPARRVLVLPTTFSRQAAAAVSDQKQRKLVSNAIDRSLCINLSEKFELVGADRSSDLIVQAQVTAIQTTNPFTAAASKGAMVVPIVTGIPIPVPRVPYGFGSLTVEAEARDPAGNQAAAMVWARGADVMASSATIHHRGRLWLGRKIR